MRANPLPLLLMAAVTACGTSGSDGSTTPGDTPPGDTPPGGASAGSPPPGSTSPDCSCPGGTCDATGVCILPQATPVAPLTCPGSATPVGVSTAPAAQVQHLGTLKVGSVASFTVPAGTASVTIIEQAVSAPDVIALDGIPLANTAVPLLLGDASGNVLYDDTQAISDPAAIARQPVFFASDSPGTGTLTIPNTTGGLALLSAGSLPPGTWGVTVSDYAYECATGRGVPRGSRCTGGSTLSSYDVTVILKRSDAAGIPAAGTLDLAIYFATGSAPLATVNLPLSAATARAGADPDLSRMLQSLGQLLARAGITLGSVTFTDLPPAVQAAYATGVDVDQTGACGALSQLLRLSSPGNTLNVFFVSSFQASGLRNDNQVVGIDGTIPGPSTVGGTVASGAAVATHDLRAGRSACAGDFNTECGADVTAYIVAHEAGHFLGLYHVTESAGTAFDPLLDSPTCPCRSCAPAASLGLCADATPPPPAGTEHQMSVADCTQSAACGGGDNLMFWILEQGSRGAVTDEQARVMRANALVR